MAIAPHISLVAEPIFHLGPFTITNSIFTTWLVMIVLVAGSILLTKSLKLVPNRKQAALELVIDNLDNLFSSILGGIKGRQVFTLLTTIFLFVIVSNWSGLLPGVGSIVVNEKTNYEQSSQAHPDSDIKLKSHSSIPLLRAPTADLNTTLALALIAMGSIQFLGLKALGTGYLKKFFNFSSPIFFFVGILELISEFSRVISFTFRLFGNIFAGEVLLTVIGFLAPILAPIPFLGLEIFVGFIQALVFAMLTVTFLSMATSHDHH